MNAPHRSEGFLPLAGIRVVEVSYGIAAPLAGRQLAALGADVVKIESRRRPDGLRHAAPAWLPPEIPPAARMDANFFFAAMHAGKRSVMLELDIPDGYNTALRLLAQADVFLSNLLPDVLDRLGLGPARLAAANPRLIYTGLSTFGDASAGEYRTHRTWGLNLGAFCGLYSITGWPEDLPNVWSINYTDYLGALYGTAATLAALLRRRQTGTGQYLDLALYEIVAAGLGEHIERALNEGVALQRNGNREPRYFLQDVFALHGDERWLALTARDEADAAAVISALGIAADGANLETALAAAVATLTEDEIRDRLRGVAVPWEIVADARDVLGDPRLAADGFWQLLPQRRLGVDFVPALPFLADGRRIRDRSGFPAMGEHTAEVLAEAGFTPGEIAGLTGRRVATLLGDPEVAFGPRPGVRTLQAAAAGGRSGAE